MLITGGWLTGVLGFDNLVFFTGTATEELMTKTSDQNTEYWAHKKTKYHEEIYSTAKHTRSHIYSVFQVIYAYYKIIQSFDRWEEFFRNETFFLTTTPLLPLLE